MSSPRRKLFVTTALPYANGPFHIGHIMEYIQADVWVRFQRMQGHEVHFVCADDTHGAPIMLKAESEGVTPQVLVARIAATRPKHLDGFRISFDHWHSTDSPENVELSQDIYRKLKAAGLIYTRTDRAVLRSGEADVPAGSLHQGRMPGMRHEGPVRRRLRELQLGLRTDRPQEPVLDSVRRNAGAASPPSTSSSGCRIRRASRSCASGRSANACSPKSRTRPASGSKGKGDKALGDWDISRDAPYFGIPIPDAPGKYFYVWLDAPVGYLASLKAHLARRGIDFVAFLADPAVEQVHFIGKDIIYHHTLFWPAMLKFAGAPYKVPDNVYVHGFINVSGEKMSKSRGTGISPDVYLDLGLDPEWLRYYIAAKLNGRVEDIDFNPDDFVARVNSDLIGKYVNIASRAAPFLTRHFDGVLATPAETEDERANRLTIAQLDAETARANYEAREYGRVLRDAMRDRRPHQRGVRRRAAVAAREGSGQARCAADDRVAIAAGLPAAEGHARAGAAEAREPRRARAVRHGPRFRLERRVEGRPSASGRSGI